MQTLYQHGTLATLMAGHLEGTATIDEILQHGDSGIGTLTGSDGEVIYLDGRAFHANEFGEFKALEGNEMTPFSTITRFSEIRLIMHTKNLTKYLMKYWTTWKVKICSLL